MADVYSTSSAVDRLLAGGVIMPLPSSVYVAADVDPVRVAAGVVLHPGCRLEGSATSVGPGCVLGEDGPVTLRNTQLSLNVRLRGGTFESATLLDGVDVGPNAHVRPGTLLEEGVRLGHAVGLKQSVLLPYVTGGSLINFCDILMGGGSGPESHSEIGSSYVHFNFTPRGDKATASLVGEVPRGVMMKESPVFLGGQGGLVGPTRVGFGSVIPAGTIWRTDALADGCFLSNSGVPERVPKDFNPGRYGKVARVVRNNLVFIGNLVALRAWYRHVRILFVQDDPFAGASHEGALARLGEGLAERRKRLQGLAEKMPSSLRVLDGESIAGREAVAEEQALLVAQWPAIDAALRARIDSTEDAVHAAAFETLRAALDTVGADGYLASISGLAPSAREAGTAWLQGLVDGLAGLWPSHAPGGER